MRRIGPKSRCFPLISPKNIENKVTTYHNPLYDGLMALGLWPKGLGAIIKWEMGPWALWAQVKVILP